MVAAGAHTAGEATAPRLPNGSRRRRSGVDTYTCTPRLTGTRDSLTPKAYPTRRPSPRSRSCTALGSGSPHMASPGSSGSSLTTAPATARRPSREHYLDSGISGSRRTRHVTTGKWSATTGSSPRNSFTPGPGPQKPSAEKPSRSGTSTTTTTDPTRGRRSAASLTTAGRRHQRHGPLHLALEQRRRGSAARTAGSCGLAAFGIDGGAGLPRGRVRGQPPSRARSPTWTPP